MSDLITDAMVESALEASYDPPKEPGYTFLNRDAYRSLWSPHMRAALEAVAPAIAAKALMDAADEVRTHSYTSDEVTGVPTSEQVSWLVGTSDAHRMVDRLLKDRAERIEHDARCPHRKCPGTVGVCCCPAVES